MQVSLDNHIDQQVALLDKRALPDQDVDDEIEGIEDPNQNPLIDQEDYLDKNQIKLPEGFFDDEEDQ